MLVGEATASTPHWDRQNSENVSAGKAGEGKRNCEIQCMADGKKKTLWYNLKKF